MIKKGWTLLNRGTVIGKNHFNIEQFILGLSDRDCSELIKEKSSAEKQLNKYKQMFDVAKYKDEISELKDDLVFEKYDEAVQREIDILTYDYKTITEELKRINKVSDENKSFKNYIEKMRLRVKSSSGEEVPVNKDTIIDFKDVAEILLAKRKIVTAELADIKRKIEKYNIAVSDQEVFIKTESLIQIFDKKISTFDINSGAVEKVISGLEKERRRLRQAITAATKLNNSIVTEIYNTTRQYAAELELEKYMNPRQDYIFTDDLKSLSGAILHKIVFVFKLAYIKAAQEKLNINLPIILDSPSGRELDKTNINKMMEILSRDFSENQIIISSIFTYSFNEVKTFELGELLIDNY